MSLDDKFGPCLPPDHDKTVSVAEQEFQPISLHEVDDAIGPLLYEYMDKAHAPLSITRTLHRSNNILWMIDCAGKLWVAIEEVVDLDSGEFVRSHLRNASRPGAPNFKLGHPSLLPKGQSKKARIAGEIFWSPDHKDWVINNTSGRFGLRSHQTEDHLKEAAALFKFHGIDLIVKFEEPY